MTATREVLARAVLLAVLALVLARLALPWRPATLCPWRAVTGLPCPFCGTTTAAVAAGHGDVRAAVTASPVAAFAAPLLASWPLVAPAVRRVPVRIRMTALGCALVLAETWQLHRFGLL